MNISSYKFQNKAGVFLEMTDNHLAMGGSVPRVPKTLSCWSERYRCKLKFALHRREKSPVG